MDGVIQFIKANGSKVIVAKKFNIKTIRKIPSVFVKIFVIKYEAANSKVLSNWADFPDDITSRPGFRINIAPIMAVSIA